VADSISYIYLQVEDIKEELEYSNQMFHELSVFSNGMKTEINEAKELLVRLWLSGLL